MWRLRWYFKRRLLEHWAYVTYQVRVLWQRIVKPSVHEPFDGRGPRDVFVDGIRVSHVIYADTKAGVVRYHFDPVRLNRRKTGARWAKKRGHVTVQRECEHDWQEMVVLPPLLKGWKCTKCSELKEGPRLGEPK